MSYKVSDTSVTSKLYSREKTQFVDILFITPVFRENIIPHCCWHRRYIAIRVKIVVGNTGKGAKMPEELEA
jgi:hypothetical protein